MDTVLGSIANTTVIRMIDMNVGHIRRNNMNETKIV